MLDLPAAGANRSLDRLSRMCVNHRSNSLSFGLTADGPELVVRHGLAAAFTDALGCEYFDDVRMLGFEPANDLPELICPAAVFVDLLDGGQNARPRNCSTCDRLSQVDVGFGADALNGRETGHQSGVGILSSVVSLLSGSFAAVVGASVFAEVAVNVDVNVDHPRQHRQRTQLVCRIGRARIELQDLRSLHDNSGVP